MLNVLTFIFTAFLSGFAHRCVFQQRYVCPLLSGSDAVANFKGKCLIKFFLHIPVSVGVYLTQVLH